MPTRRSVPRFASVPRFRAVSTFPEAGSDRRLSRALASSTPLANYLHFDMCTGSSSSPKEPRICSTAAGS
eukprot:5962472-Pyramimonas_sp.AAC.1